MERKRGKNPRHMDGMTDEGREREKEKEKDCLISIFLSSSYHCAIVGLNIGRVLVNTSILFQNRTHES